MSTEMAGAAGFEPTHARIKTWCLTAWRRPYVLQLDAVHPLSGQAPKRPVQHRDVASLGDKPWQGCWKLGRDSISFAFAWEGPKHATTSAGQSS